LKKLGNDQTLVNVEVECSVSDGKSTGTISDIYVVNLKMFSTVKPCNKMFTS